MVDARSYATGGTSNYEFWRDDPYHLADQLSQETHENCCTYNMLKLTEHLYSWSADARYMDYYERAFFNGILPTQHPEIGGAIMYYVPLKSGLFKMFGIPDLSYFCCNGSGIESFAKLGNSIYSHNEYGIFVNLFIASEVHWAEKGLTVRQTTTFPEQQSTKISLRLLRPEKFTISVRIPSWTTKQFAVRVNGETQNVVPTPSGYVELRKVWKQGDVVEVDLPMRLSLSRLPDDPSVSAVLYGPVVLAGELGTEAMTREMEDGLGSPDVERMVSQGAAVVPPTLVVPNADPNTWIKLVKKKPLTFRTIGVGKPHDVTLIPFYELFGQRYAVYWNMYAAYEWQAIHEAAAANPPGVQDRVLVGDDQSDRDHNFQAWRFERGERMGRKWVKSPQWFRYDLSVDPHQAEILKCTFWRENADCSFDILIDGLRMTSETLTGGKDEEFIEKKYEIPKELIAGKTRVAVMFRAKENKPTAELYDCAVAKVSN